MSTVVWNESALWDDEGIIWEYQATTVTINLGGRRNLVASIATIRNIEPMYARRQSTVMWARRSSRTPGDAQRRLALPGAAARRTQIGDTRIATTLQDARNHDVEFLPARR